MVKESRSRKRLRSRSRERRRSRNRSRSRSDSSERSRSRSRSRGHQRSSRHRSPRKEKRSHKDRSGKRRRRSRSRSRDGRKKSPEKQKEAEEDHTNESENDRLEREMMRRRERIEQWREDRRKLMGEASAVKEEDDNKPLKVINLENDEDDDDEDEAEKGGDDDPEKKEDSEIDPLDAFMMGLNEEMKDSNPKSNAPTKTSQEKNKIQTEETAMETTTTSTTTTATTTTSTTTTSTTTTSTTTTFTTTPSTTTTSTTTTATTIPSTITTFTTTSTSTTTSPTTATTTIAKTTATTTEPTRTISMTTKTPIIKAVSSKVEKGELMESNMDALEYSSEAEEVDDLDDLGRNKKKKELPQVNHSKVMYGKFRKDFYFEVPEIANMSLQEVVAYRRDLDEVAVTGTKCPKPIKSWAQCGISRRVLEILKKHNFVKPTPIQAQSLPIIMSGRDMIGIAKTGSGKTLAFVLPLLRHVCDQSELRATEGPIAVILTPTRELAMQIGVECRKFCKNLSLRCLCIYGGRPISEQIAELKRGAEIIVCTPGRMIDMLTANSGRVTNLRRCTYTVLDEADRMFDMGFEQQVLKIINNIRPDSQTVLFSATFPPKIENLARRILTKPLEVAVGRKSVVCEEVEQHVLVIDDNQKFLKLLELLGLYQEQGSVLVFVHKQEHSDELMKNLMKQGYPCLSLHGGIDQYDRDSTMLDFKQGNIKLLIATSVCSRGLDVKDLILVLNYDCPNHYEDYVHRCGRTGRAGKHGFAYTFVSRDQGRYAGDIIKALKYSKVAVPEDLIKLWDEYKKEAEAEGKTVKSSSGFKGKGFKFDETEAQLADDRRKLQKAALGLQDSDEEDAGVDIEEKIEQMFASKKWVSDVAKSTAAKLATINSNSTMEKLEMAKKAAAQINKLISPANQAADINQQTAAAILKGGVAISQVSSKTIAEQMAGRINAKLGYRPVAEEEKDVAPVEESEGMKRFEEELEINDFPQTARWKVTSRDALGQICEFSEAGITVRGSYFPPNKEPKEGEERKLYLAIEASSEIALGKAKSEVTRLIKEELVRLQNSYQPINRNRYKVV